MSQLLSEGKECQGKNQHDVRAEAAEVAAEGRGPSVSKESHVDSTAGTSEASTKERKEGRISEFASERSGQATANDRMITAAASQLSGGGMTCSHANSMSERSGQMWSAGIGERRIELCLDCITCVAW